MIKEFNIAVIAVLISLTSSLVVNGQEDGNQYFSRNDGSYESTASWFNTNHDDPRTGINPGCKLTTGFQVYIEDSLISECNPMLMSGDAQLNIRNGGKLEVNGDLNHNSNTSITIDQNSSLTINSEMPIEIQSEYDSFKAVLNTLNQIDLPSVYELKSGRKTIVGLKQEDVQKITGAVQDFRKSILI